MDNTLALDGVRNLIEALNSLMGETAEKFLNDDKYITDNVNFFSKSFLVIACAYLEGYIKDVTKIYLQHQEENLKRVNVPQNLIKWSVQSDKFKVKDENNFNNFKLSIDSRIIDENVSANPYTIKPFFVRLGINLRECEGYDELAETVETIVNLRNSIIHHNDDASSMTLGDVIENSNTILSYIELIDNKVVSSLN